VEIGVRADVDAGGARGGESFLRAAGGGGERRERKGRRGRRRGRRGPGVSRERGGGVGVRESGVFIIAQRGGVGNIIDAAVGVKRT